MLPIVDLLSFERSAECLCSSLWHGFSTVGWWFHAVSE